jgi:hypothetical protein
MRSGAMGTNADPGSYEEWRTDPIDRAEGAAYTFGYHLIGHCRDEAMKTLAPKKLFVSRETVEKAVDTALHNVVDMLEGFWKLDAGPNHSVEFVLGVRVHDSQGKAVEKRWRFPRPNSISRSDTGNGRKTVSSSKSSWGSFAQPMSPTR